MIIIIIYYFCLLIKLIAEVRCKIWLILISTTLSLIHQRSLLAIFCFKHVFETISYSKYMRDFIVFWSLLICLMLEISVLAWIRIIFQSDTIRMKLCSCWDHGVVHLFQFTLCSPLIIIEVIALLLVFVYISSVGVSFLSL